MTTEAMKTCPGFQKQLSKKSAVVGFSGSSVQKIHWSVFYFSRHEKYQVSEQWRGTDQGFWGSGTPLAQADRWLQKNLLHQVGTGEDF